jgi:hypothetical protein
LLPVKVLTPTMLPSERARVPKVVKAQPRISVEVEFTVSVRIWPHCLADGKS